MLLADTLDRVSLGDAVYRRFSVRLYRDALTSVLDAGMVTPIVVEKEKRRWQMSTYCVSGRWFQRNSVRNRFCGIIAGKAPWEADRKHSMSDASPSASQANLSTKSTM